MPGYTNPFGGSAVLPAQVAYREVTLSQDTTLTWPSVATDNNYVARAMSVTASDSSLSLTMPDARVVSAGFDVMFINPGSNTYTVKDNDGGVIVTVTAGQAQYVLLKDNTNNQGVWTAFQFASLTSAATAASLVGSGMRVDPDNAATLGPKRLVDDFNSNSRPLVNADVAKLLDWTGGSATYSPGASSSATALGDGFFFGLRNSGTGTLVFDGGGSNTDGIATLTLLPGEACELLSNGTEWRSVGRGRSATFNWTRLVKAVTTGAYTLTVSECSRVIQEYTGALLADVTITLQPIVQVYFIQNSTVHATFTVTFTTGAGTSVSLTQSQTAVLICDGTDVINASTTLSGFTSLLLAQGSAASPSYSFSGSTDTGMYQPTTGEVAWTAAGAQQMRAASTGVLIGAQTSRAVGGSVRQLQIEKGSGQASISVVRNSADNTGASITLGKSRSAAVGGVTVVQNADELGQILFVGADGVDADSIGAGIVAYVDGTPGSNDMPGRLVFFTTADGAATTTERMRISSAGVVSITGSLTTTGNATIGDASTDTLTIPLGAAALPSLLPSGATNTGLWFPSTSAVALSGGGVEVLRASSGAVAVTGTLATTGNVTVGDASTDTLTVPVGAAALPSILPSGATNSGIWFPSTTSVAVSTAGTERVRVNATGSVLVGASNSRDISAVSTTITPGMQVSTLGIVGGIATYRWANLAAGANVIGFAKSRGTTDGDFTIVANGDALGYLTWSGADGTNFEEAARITCEVDAAPGANDMPGRLLFLTTADGAVASTERLRIDSAGLITVASGGVLALQAGAVGTPAITPTGDPNTGFWFPAADTIAVSTAGSERLRVTSAGVVGIGSSTVSHRLTVSAPDSDGLAVHNSSESSTRLYAQTRGGATVDRQGVVQAFRDTVGALPLVLNPDGGNVVIGVASSVSTVMQGTLDVRSSTGANIVAGRTSNAAAASEFGFYDSVAPNASGTQRFWTRVKTVASNATAASESADLVFMTIGTSTLAERMRLDSAGRLGVGVTAPAAGYKLQISGGTDGNIRIVTTDETTSGGVGLYLGSSTFNRASIQTFNVGTQGADLVVFTAPAASSIVERVRISSVGVVTALANVASTSTATGTIVVTGGLGVSGAVFAGSVQNTPIGSTTPSTGAFTSLTTTGNVTVGDASTDTITIPLGSAALPVLLPSGATNTGLWFPTTTSVAASTSGVERARLTAAGQQLIGTTSARTFSGAAVPWLQVETLTDTRASVTNNSASATGAALVLGKTRSVAVGGVTIVSSGDGLGYVMFEGADGAGMIRGAQIHAEVDGTPGVNDMPGRLIFSTTPDGAASVSERMRIDNAGLITIASGGILAAQPGAVATPSIIPTGDPNTGLWFPAADTVAVSTAGAESLRVDSSQRLLVGVTSGNANGGVLQLKSGITFPATQVASTDVNTLDDYEEGTFTPALSGTGCTFSYASRSGTYTKIGRMVYVFISIQLNNTGNTLAANAVTITGLPFAAAVSGVSPVSWTSMSTGFVNLNGVTSGTSVILQGITAANITSTGAVLGTHFDATGFSAISLDLEYSV